MLYVAGMEKRLLQTRVGFSLTHLENGEKVNWILPGLTFADDIVLTAETVEDLQKLLDVCTTEAAARHLNFNAKKSAVVQFTGSEEITVGSLQLSGEAVPVQSAYKYLGITLSTASDYLQEYHAHLRQSAVRGAGILRKRSLWCCNRFMVTRELWKSVMVPGLSFANAVVCVPGEVREFLERRQREVGRMALGCHGNVANEAVQGDLGWSSFEAREASSKVAYDGRLRHMDRCRWAKRLFVYTYMTGVQTRWQRRLYQLESKYGFFAEPVEAPTAEKWEAEVRRRVRESEAIQWLEAAQAKTTLKIYTEGKQVISAETHLFENSLGSRLL